MERSDLGPTPAELMPAIVQDATTGRVLMLAWMDEEALRRTRETGEAWFWSRSRQEYWHKGATSGNTLAVEPDRAALRTVGFSDRDIWDIASTAAFYNMSNRVAAAVDMRPNDEYHAMAR